MAGEGRTISEEEKQAIIQGKTDKPEVKVEDKTDEKVVEDKKENVEQKPEQIEKKEQPKKEDFNPVSFFNTKWEKNFESEDDIKAFVDKADKYDQVEATNKDYEQKLKELAEIAKGVDPLKHFANKDEYIRQQFLKNNADKLSEEAVNELSALSPEKVKGLSEIDALVKDLVVNEGVSSEGAREMLLEKYGLEEFNLDELSAGKKAMLKVDSNKARERLSDVYKGIDVPETIDWEARRESRKESWESPLKQSIDGIDKISLTEDLDFVVDSKMKEGLEQEIMSELLVQGIDPSEEALGNVVASARDKLLLRNIDKVVQSIEADLSEKIKADIRKDVHNDQPLKDDARPEGGSVDRDKKIISAWG